MMGAVMAAVAGIMIALSVDELMPLAKELDPQSNPSYGVLCGMSVMGLNWWFCKRWALAEPMRQLFAALYFTCQFIT